MHRTIKISLGSSAALETTMRFYNQACQAVIDAGWENESFDKFYLQRITYRQLRTSFPALQSSLILCATHEAAGILRRCRLNRTRPKKKALSSIRFNSRSFTPKLDEGILNLSTIEGRRTFNIVVPPFYQRFKEWRVASPTLVRRPDGRFFLYVVVVREPPVAKSEGPILGIDLGITNIAVCSNNRFFSAKRLRKVKGCYCFLRARLQSVGTRSAKRKLRKLSRRENRFVTDVNHCISKKIVSLPYSTLVFEDLDIRKQKKLGRAFNKKLGNWSYDHLQRFTSYKAEERGKRIVFIDPRYTSQTCSTCGTCEKRFRQGKSFACGNCGLRLNADLNAARNIALRACSQEQAVIDQPIVAGGHDARTDDLLAASCAQKSGAVDSIKSFGVTEHQRESASSF